MDAEFRPPAVMNYSGATFLTATLIDPIIRSVGPR